MKRALLSFTLLSATFLVGCDHYSEKLAALDSELGSNSAYTQDATSLNNVETAAGGVEATVPYDRALAQAYYQRAMEENERMDYRAAQYFTGKAYEALHGQQPQPAVPREFGISSQEDHAELDQARSKLIAALQAPKTPENQQALIEAQVNYDGWVDQVAEDKKGSALTCRDSFMNALAKIEDPFVEGARYKISFVTGQTALDAAGQKAIADVAALVRDNPGKQYKVVLRQYGSNPENARFQSIYNALTLQGVQGEGIFSQTASIDQPAGVQPVAYGAEANVPVELIVKFERADVKNLTPPPATTYQQ